MPGDACDGYGPFDRHHLARGKSEVRCCPSSARSARADRRSVPSSGWCRAVDSRSMMSSCSAPTARGFAADSQCCGKVDCGSVPGERRSTISTGIHSAAATIVA